MQKIIITFLSIIFLLVSCKDQNSNLPLAEFKTGKILFSDFEKDMLEYKYNDDINRARNTSMEEKRNFLKEMVYREIIFDLAEKNQLDTITSVKNEYKNKLYSEAIINGLVIDSITNKLYTDNDLKRIYEQKKVRYLPEHILIDVKKHKSGPAKSKIDSIYQKLNSGENFEELAKKYSDDVKTGVEGGSLGWVFSYDVVKEFEDKLLNMKVGEYTEPFLSEYGYHILYLKDSKKNNDLKSYEKEEKSLRNDLNKMYSAQFNNIVLKMIDDLIVKFNVKIDSVNIKQFIKQNKKYTEQVKNDQKAEPLDLFSTIEKKMIFAQYEDIIIDANKLIAVLKSFPKEKRPVLTGYNDIKLFIVEKIRNKLLENYVDLLGYTKNEEFIKNAKLNMYESYKDKLITLMVKSKVPEPDTAELQNYYDENKEIFKNDDGTYKEFLKVKVSILNSIKGKKFSSVMKDWEKNTFNDYSVKYNYSLLEDTFYYVKDDRK